MEEKKFRREEKNWFAYKSSNIIKKERQKSGFA